MKVLMVCQCYNQDQLYQDRNTAETSGCQDQNQVTQRQEEDQVQGQERKQLHLKACISCKNGQANIECNDKSMNHNYIVLYELPFYQISLFLKYLATVIKQCNKCFRGKIIMGDCNDDVQVSH